MTNDRKIREAWNQSSIPVIIRRTGEGEKHRLRIPYSEENRNWLRNNRRSRPDWFPTEKYWEIPKAWFNDFVNRSLDRFGTIWIIQPYRIQEKCASQCMNATGHECQCSCMGANHGAGNDGSWFEVNETFAVKWQGAEWACRLLERR